MNPTLKLLKAKRSSALKDARKMEAQLARLNKEAEAAGSVTNIRYIVGLFRDLEVRTEISNEFLAQFPGAGQTQQSKHNLLC